MKTFNCSVAQKGFFAGPIHCIHINKQIEEKKAENPVKENEKLLNAIELLKKQISKMQCTDKNAAIRDTVLSIISDDAFNSRISKNINELHLTALSAVQKAAKELSDELMKADSEYIRLRQDDIRGAAEKLIAIMEGESDKLEEYSAICAKEISPAQFSSFDEKMIGGMLTDKGSPNSHVSIMAGNIGIPYLYGNQEALEEAKKSGLIILDAENGIVITDPDEKTLNVAMERMKKNRKVQEEKNNIEEEKIDYSTNHTKVYANIEGPQDIEALLDCDADGVGLFRTEFLFLGRDSIPTEEEQYNAYKKVLEAMGEKEVIIRTMDIGSDKKVSWLKLSAESNPALGMRGVRVSLEHEDIFRTQLRALLRAGVVGNLKIMFPMISSIWEIDEIKEKIKKIIEELKKENIPHKEVEIGIMIETPAAAICAEEYAQKVGFFSIGTNDLTQYTIALDREIVGMDRYFNPYHEAVFQLIKMATDGGHKHNIKTGVCGQLGADPNAVKKLIEIGVDELSVPIRKVKETKKIVFDIEKNLLLENKKVTDFSEKKKDSFCVGAVSDGELISMEEIPDSVFSEGSMGPCFGIIPREGKIYSPVTGTVVGIAKTAHALTLRTNDGRNILVHVGIDTVKLGGKAFKLHVKEGDSVLANQLLLDANLEMIKKAGLSEMVIVVALKE